MLACESPIRIFKQNKFKLYLVIGGHCFWCTITERTRPDDKKLNISNFIKTAAYFKFLVMPSIVRVRNHIQPMTLFAAFMSTLIWLLFIDTNATGFIKGTTLFVTPYIIPLKLCVLHCVKCHNFIWFYGVEILWKGTVSAFIYFYS